MSYPPPLFVGSLFTGIGGLDLAFERAGFQVAWQVEVDPDCLRLLDDKWPRIPKYGDIRTEHRRLPYTGVIVGGDPCPAHSRARSNGAATSPDLSGYFLAVVGRLRPRWVVRENVPAPTVDHFALGLEYLGYGTAVIRIDAATLTGQSRQRDFVVGHYQAPRSIVRELFSDFRYGSGRYTTVLGEGQVVAALTTHRTRYDSRDTFIWNEHEPDRLRILDAEEREALAGLPSGWTAGFSDAVGSLTISGLTLTELRKLSCQLPALSKVVAELRSSASGTASCTIRGSSAQGLRITMRTGISTGTTARSAVSLAEAKPVAEAGAMPTISHGNGTATPSKGNAVEPIELRGVRDIQALVSLGTERGMLSRWRPYLADPLLRESLSTILTWTSVMTPLPTYIFAQTVPNMGEYTGAWRSSPGSSLSEALYDLEMEPMSLFSDAVRARMCGNCVVPAAAQIIADRIAHAERHNAD